MQSAQNLEFRRHIVKTQALQAGVPIALMIPISGIILWFGMRPAIRRLERNRIGLELVNRTDGSGLIARLRFDSAMTVSSEASPDRAPLESEAPIAAPATDPI